jgi:hypothetical protein
VGGEKYTLHVKVSERLPFTVQIHDQLPTVQRYLLHIPASRFWHTFAQCCCNLHVLT